MVDGHAVSRQVLRLTEDLVDLYRCFTFYGEAHILKVEMIRDAGIGYRATWSLGAGEGGMFCPYDGIEYVRREVAKMQATLQYLIDLLGE